jgi:hypothetical protein
MEFNDYLDRFYAMEERAGLFEISLRGYPVWDFVRYAAFFRILYLVTSLEDVQARARLHEKLVNIGKDIVRTMQCRRKSALRDSHTYDIACLNVDGRVMVNGHRVSVYHYFPMLELQKEWRVVSFDPSFVNWGNEAQFPWETIFLRPHYLFARIGRMFVKLSAKERAVLSEIHDEINRSFGVVLDLSSTWTQHVLQHKIFIRQFAKNKPRIMLYSNDGCSKGAILAARESDVATCELQHCILSRLHPEYWYPKSLLKRNHKGLVHADYIFTWGELWEKKVQLDSKMVPVGNPYLEWQERTLDADLIRKGRAKRIIIVANGYSRRKLISVAIGLAQSMPDYTIVYKLRSDDFQNWRERYPRELQVLSNLEVVDTYEKSFYEHLLSCRYQIGVTSTGLLEGVYFGLRTFILRHGMYKEMNCLADFDSVEFVSTMSEIVESIKSNEFLTSGVSPCPEAMIKKRAGKNLAAAVRALVDQNKKAPELLERAI